MQPKTAAAISLAAWTGPGDGGVTMRLDEARSIPEGAQEGSPSPEAVRTAVERIVTSPDFAASDRARRFLRYVVEEALAGRADRIKAFSVAVEVFGRDESFDPQNDPVVRIEAGRLRRISD